jgi:flavin-dependent dehydrogenase
MITSKVIIIGGGPAGSTCGWKLKKQGVDCLNLDKQKFPRTKLCAGWITPQVIKDLEIDVDAYPHSLVKFDQFHVHIKNKYLKVKVNQYGIRRYEFDNWLLKRSGVSVHTHEVKNITRDGDSYVIDNQFRCKYLIGAGGTHCPVYRTFFKQVSPRARDLLIVTLEQEFAYDYHDQNCHLWFVQNNLPGYSWYVPKGNGYLNVGIGGFAEKLKANHDNIKNHWQFFVQELERLSLVKDDDLKPGGYVYYIRNGLKTVQLENAFLVGDAAGLATRDMGEGIGPAVQSGILAARSIIEGKSFSLTAVKKNSFPRYRTLLKLMGSYFFNSTN